MTMVDKDELLEWLKKEFYLAKKNRDSSENAKDHWISKGEMNAYQYLKFAIDTGEGEFMDRWQCVLCKIYFTSKPASVGMVGSYCDGCWKRKLILKGLDTK